MGRNAGPKGNLFVTPEDEGVISGQSYGTSHEDEISSEPVLASGWWILPFALGGLIECYFIFKWIAAYL
jgi:hypothetical protein